MKMISISAAQKNERNQPSLSVKNVQKPGAKQVMESVKKMRKCVLVELYEYVIARGHSQPESIVTQGP